MPAGPALAAGKRRRLPSGHRIGEGQGVLPARPFSSGGSEMPVSETNDEAVLPLVATGIPGLDDVLGGGFTPNRVYLIEGNPGSGKTTLALRWLLEGERLGEKGIYVTLSETKIELDRRGAVARLVARRHQHFGVGRAGIGA